MQLKEIWKQIKMNKSYEISDLGNVRSVDRTIKYSDGRVMKWKGRLMKKQNWTNGYQFVFLSSNKTGYQQYSIHRLVAIAFIDNPNKLPQVNHKNGIKTDNRAGNLEWVTMSGNNFHSYRTGLKKHHRCWLGKTGYSHNKSKEVIERDEHGKELRRFGSGRECMSFIGKINLGAYIKRGKPYKGKFYTYCIRKDL